MDSNEFGKKKFHSEIIEILQNQCDDKMVLEEERMIKYGYRDGYIKSVLNNEIYKHVRYEIINHVGNDTNINCQSINLKF